MARRGALKLIWSGSHAEILRVRVPGPWAGMVPFLRCAWRARPAMRAGLHPPIRAPAGWYAVCHSPLGPFPQGAFIMRTAIIFVGLLGVSLTGVIAQVEAQPSRTGQVGWASW
jgi:hypothetical protein